MQPISNVSRRGFVVGGLTASATLGGSVANAAAGLAPDTNATTDVTANDGGADRARRPTGQDEFADPESTFFSTVSVEESASLPTESGGDLWPTCWADDDHVYAANGDGRGFADEPLDEQDIVVSRVEGTPTSGLTGRRLAAGDQLGTIWADPEKYNRKPTGMVCVGGVLYLAYQDLRKGPDPERFNDAPNASLSRSDDHGATWTTTSEPMFTDHRFTTIMFLDFGRNSEHAVPALGRRDGGYVYAYALDWNWRRSTTGTVPDPQSVYLARVRPDDLQKRAAWRFFAGFDGADRPVWSKRIEDKAPVLHDPLRRYTSVGPDLDQARRGTTTIAQGGVIYNAGLKRYIFSSWSGYGFEFYEAPRPWGPWRRFLHHNFGAVPWYVRDDPEHTPKQGGYGTVIPTKYVSADGQTMWVNSNWWEDAPDEKHNYSFCLRKVTVTPRRPSRPKNPPDRSRNLARDGSDVTPIGTCAHHARWNVLNDGDEAASEDSFDSRNKSLDYWGYTFSRIYWMNRLEYVTGKCSAEGGWFSGFGGGLRVQVRRDGVWSDVDGLRISPDYPYDETAGPGRRFTLRFDRAAGDGVRVVGEPGGSRFYTSVAELEVYHGD